MAAFSPLTTRLRSVFAAGSLLAPVTWRKQLGVRSEAPRHASIAAGRVSPACHRARPAGKSRSLKRDKARDWDISLHNKAIVQVGLIPITVDLADLTVVLDKPQEESAG